MEGGAKKHLTIEVSTAGGHKASTVLLVGGCFEQFFTHWMWARGTGGEVSGGWVGVEASTMRHKNITFRKIRAALKVVHVRFSLKWSFQRVSNLILGLLWTLPDSGPEGPGRHLYRSTPLHFYRSNILAPIKIKSALPPPKTQNTPPLKRGILWTWFFLQNRRFFSRCP